MKYIFSTLLLFTFLSTGSSQIKSFGLIAGAGYTVIDINKVVDPYPPTDWDKLGLVFKGFADYELAKGKLVGLEIGRNRLYYWQYQPPGYSYYNGATEWTTNIMLYATTYLGERFYIQAGPGLHVFKNGSAFALLAAVGTTIPISVSISLPVTFRIEPVFGTATPVAFNLATGIRFNR